MPAAGRSAWRPALPPWPGHCEQVAFRASILCTMQDNRQLNACCISVALTVCGAVCTCRRLTPRATVSILVSPPSGKQWGSAEVGSEQGQVCPRTPLKERA